MHLSPSTSPSFLVCNTKVFQPGEQHITRLCNKSVLILMKQGELCFRENGRLVRLTSGEYYIQRHGLLQEGVPLTDPPIYFYIEFQGSYEEAGSGLPLRGTFHKKNVFSLTERLYEQFKARDRDLFKVNSYMLRIFSELMSNAGLKDEKQSAALWIRNYLDSNYYSRITVRELSKTFGYHEDYISRIFKEQYGTSPHQYLIRRRMEHAHWLLKNTELTVERIAFSVGYTDFSVFYRGFRKAFGISPGECRSVEKNL